MTYGMVIDLKACIGCKGCVTACKGANGTPPGVFRSKVIREMEGSYPSTKVALTPTLCMHCENAPCVEICPTGATTKLDNGIVIVDKEVCIGCESCVNVCPYEARTLCEYEDGYYGEMTEYEVKMYENMPSHTVDKCDFCHKKVEAGEQPACVAACMALARHFGDLDELKKQYPGAYQLKEEEGTNPAVLYLPAV